MSKKLTTDEFIKRSIKKHGYKYDYSISVYINKRTKIKYICPEHGVVDQYPLTHINYGGCPLCFNKGKTTLKNFIERSNIIHNYKYNYDKVIYIKAKEKVIITCPIHDDFLQKPNDHLTGYSCIKCSGRYSKKDEYIKNFNKIHDNKYDYSLVNYKNNKKKVQIICPIHGIFEQRPDNHIQGNICPSCSTMTKDTFIKKSNKIHNNKYDYSLVQYINTSTKIKIICPKHGIFNQKIHSHLYGQGCSMCNESKGEKSIREKLENDNIIYKCQKKFDGCKNINPLPFDFYLPDYNTCIEFDGIQHFKSIKQFGGNKSLLSQQKRDKIKNEYCKNNNIHLIRIKYNDNISEKLSNIFN